jgi:predicted GTPase
MIDYIKDLQSVTAFLLILNSEIRMDAFTLEMLQILRDIFKFNDNLIIIINKWVCNEREERRRISNGRTESHFINE